MMRLAFHSGLLVSTLLLSVPAAGRARALDVPAPDATQAAARSAVTRLEAAVNARDLGRILALYAPDSLLRQDASARYAGPLALDSLRCREHLGAVYARGDTAEAVVGEEASWIEHARPQGDFTWRTLDLVRTEGDWRIVSDREREYAHARSTDLRVDLHPEKGTLSGTARLAVEFTAAGEDALVLRLNRGLTLQSIQGPDGRPMPFSRIADVVTVPVVTPAPPAGSPPGARPDPPESLALTLAFEGSFFNESQEQGYSQVGIAPGGSFASWVTSWYPHVAGTYSKSPGRITYTVPAGITVASSGRKIETVNEGKRSRQVFRVDQPLDFSFAAAPYFHRSRDVDGIDVGVYFLRGGDAKAEFYISACARIFSFLHGLYGFYPFDGYAVVEIPAEAVGSLGGSSEQGMNLFPVGGLPDSLFPLPLLAHEIGHSWWGNLVSGGSAAILDEGLAQTTATLSVEAIAGEKTMRRFLRRGLSNYAQSADMYFRHFAGLQGRDLPLRTLSSGSEDGATLHDLADTKGFFVYQMLREEIGDDAFRRGLGRAVSEYTRREIRLADLRRIWEQLSRRDLGWFFEQWFARSGAPEFHMRYGITPLEGGRFEVKGAVSQTGQPYRVRAEIVLARAGRAPQHETLPITGPETSFRFVARERPDTVLFDPDYRILRWTDEFRNQPLYAEARGLYYAGETDSAEMKLAEYLERAPMALEVHCERGRWALEAGNLDAAEREFRWIIDRARIYDTDDPAVTRSEVGLGQLGDLRNRRQEAAEWYRKALARDDGTPAVRDAAAYLASPFKPRPPSVAADPALLERCAGTYAMGQGLSVEISVGKAGILKAVTPGRPPFGLREVAGTRFQAMGDDTVMFEFAGGGGRFTDLTIDLNGRVLHLQRKD